MGGNKPASIAIKCTELEYTWQADMIPFLFVHYSVEQKQGKLHNKYTNTGTGLGCFGFAFIIDLSMIKLLK